MTETADQIVQAAMAEGALQRPLELVRLVRLVKRLRPRTVVEIGTYSGGTLRSWCQCAAAVALIVSIDLPGGEFGGGYDPTRAQHIQTFARPKQRLVLVQGDSHTAEIQDRLRWELDGRQIDFLFIDGDHSYDGVKADFEEYAPLVRSGGVVAFHDVAEYPELPECQVDRFWREIKPGYGSGEFIHHGEYLGCGIGFLVMP